jgi:hypothetical protein
MTMEAVGPVPAAIPVVPEAAVVVPVVPVVLAQAAAAAAQVAGEVAAVEKVGAAVDVAEVAGRAAGSHPINPRFAWRMSLSHEPGRGVADSRAPVLLRCGASWLR